MRKCLILVAVSLFFLTACSSGDLELTDTPETVSEVQLTPYSTRTPTYSPLAAEENVTPTLLPSPTPTPRIHVVEEGQDMYGIAYLYGITLDALVAANPDVNPNLMSVGLQLVIPAPGEEEEDNAYFGPTAIPVNTDPAVCYEDLAGGAWCFVLVHNPYEYDLESVTAGFTAVDEVTNAFISIRAITPLNVIPAGKSMPMMAYFEAPAPNLEQVNVSLNSALPLLDFNARYIPLQVSIDDIDVLGTGLAAEISGEFRLAAESGTTSEMYVAVWAFDRADRLVGVRRARIEGTLHVGEELPFNVMVYSTADVIDRVEVMIEAVREIEQVVEQD